VTVDPKNSTPVRIACRNEAEQQLVKRVAETKIAPGVRTLRDEPYPIKADSVKRTVNAKIMAGAAKACGAEERNYCYQDIVANGVCEATLKGSSSFVNSVAFALNGRPAPASYDGTIRLWDTSIGICVQTTNIGRTFAASRSIPTPVCSQTLVTWT
jgi:WD40 repeat protein